MGEVQGTCDAKSATGKCCQKTPCCTIGMASLLLGAGIALAGYFVSQTIYNSKVALNTASVKGLAEQFVKADVAGWDISVKVTDSSGRPITELYKEAEAHQQEIIRVLRAGGFSDAEIDASVLQLTNNEYRDDNQKLVEREQIVYGTVKVRTGQIEKVKPVRKEVNQLIAKGITLVNGEPDYRFSKLNDIKPAMLELATKNARIAANEFAKNAGVKVGTIRNASQGNFSITDSNADYDYGQTPDKKVRVVTGIEFYLIEE
ncbi:MAG: SIMPL domain-containing protein [Bdellovibrionota bacterium]